MNNLKFPKFKNTLIIPKIPDYEYGLSKPKQPCNFKKHEKKVKKVSVAHTRQFHKKKHKIDSIILSKVDDDEIIYGARALNKRFPTWLDKPTTDWDIITDKPEEEAEEAEEALDEEFGGDYFYNEEAKHEGTVKLKAHANQEGYADYTKSDEEIPYEKIDGKKYIELEFMKKHTEETLEDPEASYRHAKDRDALNRIKIYERIKG